MNMSNDVHINDMGFSTRTFNVLNRAGLHTSGTIKEQTDFQLRKIRNLGTACLEEIDEKIPDRIKEREGEKDVYYINGKAMKYIRCLERGYTFSKACRHCYVAKDKAIAIILCYCANNLDRINEVMFMLEGLEDTSEMLYQYLRQAKINICGSAATV